jgi:hypothetical protein
VSASLENFKVLVGDAQCEWPEASAFSHLWMGVEDFISEKWADFCMQQGPDHLSLHYDGIRIDKGTIQNHAARASRSAEEGSTPANPLDMYIGECVRYIRDQAGYDVRIQEKAILSWSKPSEPQRTDAEEPRRTPMKLHPRC